MKGGSMGFNPTRSGVPEFNKNNVKEAIDQAIQSVPTITNEEHGAAFWNTHFGQAIRYSFAERLNMVKDVIESMYLPGRR